MAERQRRLLQLVRELRETGERLQGAILRSDVTALPGLAEKELALASELQRALSEPSPDGSSPDRSPWHGGEADELRSHVRAWQRIHEQNRLLLEHAHRTVSELIALLGGAAAEPLGLYGPAPRAEPGRVSSFDRRA